MILFLWLACVPLRPYDRAQLQARLMAEPLEDLEGGADAHVLAAREFATGAAVTKGSACGCN